MFAPRALCAAVLLVTIIGASAHAQPGHVPLFRKPTLSKTRIVFCYAGDLWTVARDGGEAHRLTAGMGVETDAAFSPDGSLVAFTGEYDGNTDVYVVPAEGGVPRRLTYHPGPDAAVGWTPDGRRLLFRSARCSYSSFVRLYTVGLEGGFPVEVPLPTASSGSYSPDGRQMAYVPYLQWQSAWKRYRGGQTTPIWIADLADSRIQRLPRQNSNDSCPMWVGSIIYFLSDRGGPVSLYSFDTHRKQVKQALRNDGLDMKSASAGPGAIVYEQFGFIHLFDLRTGAARPVSIRLAGDLPEVRPRLVKVAQSLRNARLSPTGVRAVFEARGEILTVPADKGDVRNLTSSTGVADRDPAWSPDGQKIAYFSDESGEYALHIRSQTGTGEVRRIALGSPPSFYYNPTWSPDGKKIAYADKRLNLWYVDLNKPTPVKVDADTYDVFQGPLTASWSPDSRWIAYARMLRNHLGAVFLYSVASGKATQVTDGMSDARSPVFDGGGKYLYFTASTDVGLTIGAADMTGMRRPVSRSVYVVVLSKADPSPLAPESDEEKGAKAEEGSSPKPAAGAGEGAAGTERKPAQKALAETRIDLDNIGQRILSLPVPARNYSDLQPGKAGTLFLLEGAALTSDPSPEPSLTLHRFDLARRKMEKVLDGVAAFAVSASGERVLYRQGVSWVVAPAAGPMQPADSEGAARALRVADVEVWVDPRAEWKQIYREVWRIQRDFLYDPGHHGLNLKAAEAKYAPWLESVASRADLNYLFEEMLGEITLGHVFVGGGDSPEPRRVRGGLLGADYRVENGRYRIARIYSGENWNPQLRAPLTQPGVNVQVGEYLLAVNGRDVPAAEEVYRFFEGTADKQTVIRVGPKPDGTDARDVTVVPVESERELRHLAWIEDNRRTVDRLSGGKLAYVYLPDTADAGYASFNRYFFSQTDRQGAVIDERYNGGGFLADYMIEAMRRQPLNLVMSREGADELHPVAAIYGPKTMIINETAGSGGDWLPWTFRRMGIGPLVGKRTWGGLVGIGGYPELIDGGMVTAPRSALYGLKGEWEVENQGVPPDFEVEYDPAAWRQGRDTQLEKAVEVTMETLRKSPPPTYKRPTYPNYHRGGPLSTGPS